MIVNSAKEFRTWVKNKDDRQDINENFIGSYYEEGNVKIKGFFNLFHGKKENIETYLPSLLDIAEDNQAVYEFLQNAVDCGSTHFYAFYNDEYFLAVNNGKKFSLKGLESILNIAQSTKTDASNIGRLGIGFKLAHRLVGKGNGTRELVHGNKGPIMFSWDRSEDLKALMSEEEIEFEGLEDNAFLLKIAITNFPTQVDEEVKDINYNNNVVFPSNELIEFRSYVTECLGELYDNDNTCFNQGTLFFIELGENKRELLDGDLDTLRNGIEYSMNTLKQLENICFNGETIVKKSLIINENSISKGTDKFNEIDPQYPDYDILYSFGFIPLDFKLNDYFSSVKQLQESPNFYKYFPMGDEVDNIALFVHCDSFQIESNRRKLTNHHTNKKLLPEIAEYIVETLNQYKTSVRTKYLQLYASILLTNKPSASEKSWLNDVFFNIIFESIKSSVPVVDGNESDRNYVKIKEVKMDIPLDKIGLSNYKWFYWYGDNHKEIINAACESNKLDLHKWNINKIEKCDIDLLNTWLESCPTEEFEVFLDEIKSTTTTNEVKELLPKIKLFVVNNERKSYNEIIGDNGYILTTSKIANIVPILQKVGMKCTNDILENHKLFSLIKHQKEEDLFKRIKSTLETTDNWLKLSAPDKLQLVNVLKDLENVGDASIKKLNIFKNILGNQCALENLVAYKELVENWQKPYVICMEENWAEIQKYLLNSETSLSDIIGENFKDIIEEGSTIDELYNIYIKNGLHWTDDLTIKILNEYGCTEDVLSLIENNPSKTAVDEFIKKLEVINLNSMSIYPPTSFEYRCIQIAAKVEATTLRNKIKIDDINLTSFTSSNELSFKCRNDNDVEKTYYMKLSDILPHDTQCTLYGKVAEMFSSINNYKTIFSADSSNYYVVVTKLKELLSPIGTTILPAQYIFILFTWWQSNSSNLLNWESIIRFGNDKTQLGKTIANIIAYAYENNLFDVLVQYKSLYIWSQHIKGKYLFSAEYTIESEKVYKDIENWCGQDIHRKEFLMKLDLYFDDSTVIKRRKRFAENDLIEWEGDNFPSSFITWVASLSNIDGDNQKKLLYHITKKFTNRPLLKQVFSEKDYMTAEELDAPKYLNWKQTKSISIYRLDTKMPIRLVYNNEQILTHINDGAYKYFQDTKHLYINAVAEEDIVSVLAQVYQDKTIPFEYQDYISVCFDSYEEQRAKDKELNMYREFFEKLQEERQSKEKEKERANEKKDKYYKEYTLRVQEFIGGDFSMPSDKVKSEHVITRYRALMYLKKRNDLSFMHGFDEKSYIRTDGYAPIPLSNGKQINVQGVKFGIWHLSTVIWNDIVEKGNYACLCTGNGEEDFMLIKTEEDIRRIAESTKNVFMRMTPTNSMNIMDTIKSVISKNQVVFDEDISIETFYTDRDVHLMLMIHPTKEPILNSMFDGIFHKGGDFNISELG